MIENEKADCIDALTYGSNRTALWRKKMSAQYPSDPRNARAAEFSQDWPRMPAISVTTIGHFSSRIAIGQASHGAKRSVKRPEWWAFSTRLKTCRLLLLP